MPLVPDQPKRLVDELPVKRAAFVRAYVVRLNATEAALEAGYKPKTAASQGSRLLSDAKVRAAVDELLVAKAKDVGVEANDVLRKLLEIASTDLSEAFGEGGQLKPIGEIPPHLRRAIASIETEEIRVEGVAVGLVRKVKLWDKVRALEALGKHLKLFVDRVELSADSSIADALKAARERARAAR